MTGGLREMLERVFDESNRTPKAFDVVLDLYAPRFPATRRHVSALISTPFRRKAFTQRSLTPPKSSFPTEQVYAWARRRADVRTAHRRGAAGSFGRW